MAQLSEAEKKKWFLHCFNEHESSLLRFASKILRNQDTAQEIVQDVFVKLWEKFEEKDFGHESQWLFTVTRNACFDLLRKNKKSHVDISNFSEKIADENESAEKILERRSEENRLINHLENLPPEQREVLQLKFAEKKSYAEISKITGMSTNHIAVFVFNIMKKLRITYSKEAGRETTKR